LRRDLFELLKQALGLPEELELVEDAGIGSPFDGQAEGGRVYLRGGDVHALIHECVDILLTALISYARREGDTGLVLVAKEAVAEALARVVGEKELLTAASTNLLARILASEGEEELVEG